MFCSECGLQLTGKFCGHCGNAAPSKADQPVNDDKPMSFSDFFKRKKDDRASNFTSKKKGKYDKREITEATIYASIVQNVNGYLKQDRGSRLPVKVDVNWDSFQLKKAIFEKFKRYNPSFKDMELNHFKLVYKSGETVRFVPGTNISFTVKEYKNDLGVAYSAVLLYLQLYDDFEDSSDDDLPPITLNSTSHAVSPVVSKLPRLKPLPTTTTTTTASVNKKLSTSVVNESTSSPMVNDHSYSKRQICAVCNCTILIGNECFICSQNAAYNESLTEDQKKGDISVTPATSPIPLDEMRSRRIAALSTDNSTDEVILVKFVTIHRMNLRFELIELFADPTILDFELKFKVIDARGQEETGVGEGINKDLICSFFSELSTSHMIGCCEKVPTIRHDMSAEHWQAVGRILLYALDIGYFPLYISPVFIIACLYGEAVLTQDELIFSFKQYVSVEEKDTITEMMETFEENNDALMDMLCAYKCHKIVKKENFKPVILELAHQELIQKPKYVAGCFAEVLKSSKKEILSLQSLKNIHKAKTPSARKVIKNLELPRDMSEQQHSIVSYLTQFIKSLTGKELSKFLRYVTGSDNLCDNIVLTFADQDIRAPRARVCISQLELAQTYSCYNDLAEEFANILNDVNSFRFSFI